MASTNYRVLSTPASRGETDNKTTYRSSGLKTEATSTPSTAAHNAASKQAVLPVGTCPATRAEINKENAQHSTGPQSVEGKAIASQNARTHGLTSKQVVLPGEDPAEYDRHRADLHAKFNPANVVESTLVDEIAQCWWRRQRVYATETAFIANRIKDLTDNDKTLTAAAAQARMFTDPAEIARMKLVMRYVATAERAYNRAFSALLKLQAERKAEEKRLSEEAEARQPKAKPGFVSQKSTVLSLDSVEDIDQAAKFAAEYFETMRSAQNAIQQKY